MSEEIIAETMRLDLALFRIKVVFVVTKALNTIDQTYFDDWKLPEGSSYAPVEATIHDRARGREGAPRMQLEEYATRVVSEIIKGRTGKFWYGASDSGVQMKTGLDMLAKENM